MFNERKVETWISRQAASEGDGLLRVSCLRNRSSSPGRGCHRSLLDAIVLVRCLGVEWGQAGELVIADWAVEIFSTISTLLGKLNVELTARAPSANLLIAGVRSETFDEASHVLKSVSEFSADLLLEHFEAPYPRGGPRNRAYRDLEIVEENLIDLARRAHGPHGCAELGSKTFQEKAASNKAHDLAATLRHLENSATARKN